MGSHSGARCSRMLTLATCQPGAGSIPCRNQFHLERHFPFVAGLRNSRHGANTVSGCINKNLSVGGLASVGESLLDYK